MWSKSSVLVYVKMSFISLGYYLVVVSVRIGLKCRKALLTRLVLGKELDSGGGWRNMEWLNSDFKYIGLEMHTSFIQNLFLGVQSKT